jgi:hypothetical protein
VKTLYLRDLRRLLPYGLGLPAAAALGALTFALLDAPDEYVARVLLLGALVTQALLAVAAVAPDRESGATAFLARLPLSNTRALLTKVLAAETFAVPTGLALYLVAASSGMTASMAFVERDLACGAVFAFGLGLLSSVAAHRSLPALLVTPCAGTGVALVALGTPYVLWTIPPWPLMSFVALGVGAAFAGLAFTTYAHGDCHRVSARPALLALAGALPALLVSLGATTAALAFTTHDHAQLEAGPSLAVASPRGDVLAVPIAANQWIGLHERVALVDQASGEAWVVPARSVGDPDFSPDGSRLLLRSTARTGGWLLDVDSRTMTPLSGDGVLGFGYRYTIWSGDGAPLLVRTNGSRVESFLPAETTEPGQGRRAGYKLAGREQLLGVLGDRLLVLAKDGVRACPPPGPESTRPKLSERPAGELLLDLAELDTLGGVVSPSGRWVLILVREPAEQAPSLKEAPQRERTRVLACATDGSLRLELPLEEQMSVRLFQERVGWSPAERYLAIETLGGAIALFEVDAERQLARSVTVLHSDPGVRSGLALVTLDGEQPIQEVLLPREILEETGAIEVDHHRYAQSNSDGPLVWSPDDRLAALPRGAGTIVDLATGETRPGGDVSGFVSADRAVPLWVPLSIEPLEPSRRTSNTLLGGVR